MSEVLNYASPETKQYRPGAGYSLLWIVNGLSLVMIGILLVSEALSHGNGMIGDAYAPIAGIVFGIPCSMGQFLFGTLPAMIYATNYRGVAGRRLLVPLLAVSLLALLGIGSLTAACILMPHTHGSGC